MPRLTKYYIEFIWGGLIAFLLLTCTVVLLGCATDCDFKANGYCYHVSP